MKDVRFQNNFFPTTQLFGADVQTPAQPVSVTATDLSEQPGWLLLASGGSASRRAHPRVLRELPAAPASARPRNPHRRVLRRHERAERAGKIGVLEERIVLEASKSRVVPVSTVHELAFGNELERDAALVPVCSSAAAGAGRCSAEPVSIGSPAEVQGLSAGRGQPGWHSTEPAATGKASLLFHASRLKVTGILHVRLIGGRKVSYFVTNKPRSCSSSFPSVCRIFNPHKL